MESNLPFIQQELLTILKEKGDLSRKEIIEIFQRKMGRDFPYLAWTTAFDNLDHLFRKKILGKYLERRTPRGRLTAIWHYVDNFERVLISILNKQNYAMISKILYKLREKEISIEREKCERLLNNLVSEEILVKRENTYKFHKKMIYFIYR